MTRQTFAYAGPRRGIPPLLDVIAPDRPHGAVVLLHGGAWVFGSRRQPVIRRIARTLGERGLASVAVDYRMLGRGGGFDESVEDVVSAIRWFREEHPLGTLPLSVLGASAGAALAAVAAGEQGVSAWVGIYGPYDFTALPGQPRIHRPTRMLLRTTDPEELRRRSPFARCTAAIPTLLFHGRRDRLVPLSHSHALVRARREIGLPVELVELDAGHSYLLRGRSQVTRHTLSTAADWLRGRSLHLQIR